MANKNGKSIDTTYLSIDQAEARGFIHRDYIAHCFRWSRVIKWLAQSKRYETARILDIGCGRLIPLATMLHSSRMSPAYYCGVDYGKVDKTNKSVASTLNSDTFDCDIWDKTSITEMALDEGEDKFNVVTCFEMLEHVEPEMVLKTLAKIKELCTEDCKIFISTPCYNGAAAANHVNEMTYEALGACLCEQGFNIQEVHGTFASMRDYKHLMTPGEKEVFDKLSGYYDVNIISTIFAPLFPEQSRNCIWECTLTGVGYQFEWPSEEKPWSSSEYWKELKQ